MRVFITGLSGSLGTALANYHHSLGDQVWGCSRNESKGVEWIRQNGHLGTLFLSCVKEFDNKSDMSRILPTMDRLYHCAAMKHVNLCEESPFEASIQNIAYTASVVEACKDEGVPVVFASTDKACMSQGVYGATKLIGERIVLKYGGSVVRLVNLISSSGSVFDLWKRQQSEGKPITITDPDMTRYFMPVRVAAQFMAERAMPGNVVIPHCRSIEMGNIAYAMGWDNKTTTGLRPGESLHQWLIAPGGRAEVNLHCYILDQGTTWFKGRSSEEGPFWDISELLAEIRS
jgi:UDP-N-acetylglucosamine 4,6-dehydratase